MYKQDKQETLFSNSIYFMGAHLEPNNRWVILAKIIPWDTIEEKYAENFKNKESGRPAKPARMALGSHIIKEKYGLSDEETVAMIVENPYLQFFLGGGQFESTVPFDASTMTWFRKRMTKEMIAEVNEYIAGGNKPNDGNPGGHGGEQSQKRENEGTLLMDATCAPSDIRFPTDVSLLNEAREKTEAIIDAQYTASGKTGVKPRTYRRKARRDYLKFARNRRPIIKTIRNAIRKQLGYVSRNLRTIESLGFNGLTAKQVAQYETLRLLYKQQEEMYTNKTHRIENRIVSISQPFIRPIKRGKANADVEFGAKVAITLEDGYARIEKLSWDAFNETSTLIEATERYKDRNGCYPERILADKIYRTRDNLRFCEEHGIRMNGPRLGRPISNAVKNKLQRALERKESGERNAIEGEFGTGKRSYNLDRLTMRLQETSEVQIHMIFLSMNLWKRLKAFLLRFFFVEFFVNDWVVLTL